MNLWNYIFKLPPADKLAEQMKEDLERHLLSYMDQLHTVQAMVEATKQKLAYLEGRKGGAA